MFFEGETAIAYAPMESHTFRAFKDYTHAVYLDMTPQREELTVASRLATRNGVPITGTIAIEIKILNEKQALIQVASNLSAQLALLDDRVMAAAQQITSRYESTSFPVFKTEAARSVVETFNYENANRHSAFELTAVNLQNLCITNECLNKAPVDFGLLENESLLESKKRELAACSRTHEQQIAIAEAKIRAEVKKIEELNNIDLEITRKRQELLLQSEKSIILRTEEGQLSENFGAVLDYKAKQLEAQKLIAQLSDKQMRSVLQAVLSEERGQNRVLSVIAGNQLGIKIVSSTDMADNIAKLTNGTDVDTPTGSVPPAKPGTL